MGIALGGSCPRSDLRPSQVVSRRLQQVCLTVRFVSYNLGIEQTIRHEAESAVTRSFLRELHAGGQAEFGVDVREVGLHGAG